MLGRELGEIHLHAAVGAEEFGRADGATAVDQRWAAEGGGLVRVRVRGKGRISVRVYLGLGLGLGVGVGVGVGVGAAEGGGLDERHAVGVVRAGVHVERGACEDGAERLGPKEALEHDGGRVGGEQPCAHACGVALVGGGAAQQRREAERGEARAAECLVRLGKVAL